MPRVVVAGSENVTSFAIINFTTPSSPTVVTVNPGFGAGCHVTLSGSNAIAGNVLGGQVRLIDVTNPAAPVLKGTLSTILGGIGAVAMRGNLVAAGELANGFGARIVLIDYSSPTSPSLLGTATTSLTAINSLAFTSDHVVVASGSNDFQIAQVDFTSPSSPIVTNFNPALSGSVSLDGDAVASRLAAGDNNAFNVKLFDAVSKVLQGTANTLLSGVNSVALSNPLVLAGSQMSINAVRINFTGPPAVTAFNPGLGGDALLRSREASEPAEPSSVLVSSSSTWRRRRRQF